MQQPVTSVSWRKERDRQTKQPTGNWILFGPAHLLKPGQVMVNKRDGSIQPVMVHRVSTPFDVDGVPCVYGWPATTEDEQAIAMAAMRVGSQPVVEPEPEQDGWAF